MTRAPFPAERHFVEQVFERLRDGGVMSYPMKGIVDGSAGDHLLFAPPFIIEESELDFLAGALERAVAEVSAAVRASV